MSPFKGVRIILLRLVLSSAAVSLFAAADPLDLVEKDAESWVQIRLETTRLETSWISEHALLESTLSGFNDRIAILQEKYDAAVAKTTQERQEIEALQAKSKNAHGDLQSAEERLKALDVKLVQMRPSLPPHLSLGLELAFRSFSNPELSPSERMQLTMTVLNRCAQFDRTITCVEELLALENSGEKKAVEVIYWGLSHGYALDRAAGKAWLGSPASGEWRWERSANATHEVAELIAIYRDKADPSFVQVPAKLANSAPSTVIK